MAGPWSLMTVVKKIERGKKWLGVKCFIIIIIIIISSSFDFGFWVFTLATCFKFCFDCFCFG